MNLINKRSIFPIIGLIAVLGAIMLFLFIGKARLPITNRFPVDTNKTDTTTNIGVVREEGRLISAFFGLDRGLPLGASIRICRDAAKADGMPIIFDREVDASTVQAGDFRVVTRSGKVGDVFCVTMMPAVDPGELRTALLIGEFGSAKDDPPTTVEIVGNLLSKDQTINFKTAKQAVTPLLAGPTLVLAEVVPQEQWKLGEVGDSWGSGSGCPQGTAQVVRAVWAGGVVKANGDELGDVERLLYRVKIEQNDGKSASVAPFALADLGDGDNNHLLCFLDATGTPRMVSFPAGYLIDPNHDLNPNTSVAVSPPTLP